VASVVGGNVLFGPEINASLSIQRVGA